MEKTARWDFQKSSGDVITLCCSLKLLRVMKVQLSSSHQHVHRAPPDDVWTEGASERYTHPCVPCSIFSITNC